MELCGGSYTATEELVDCSPPGPCSNNDAQPSTPVPTRTPERGAAHHVATPSPLFLNPMTDEDWSSRKLSSSLKLSLSDDHTRELIAGVQVLLLRDEKRIPVTMRFNDCKSMLRITFDVETVIGDEKKGDEEKVDAPFDVPITSIAALIESELSFTTKLTSNYNGIHKFDFECSSPSQLDAVLGGLKTFMDANKPRGLLPKGRLQGFSPLDGRFSPMSLTEDPSREDAISPINSSESAANESPRIRMHEASMPSKALSTPAEQGMELTLVDTTLDIYEPFHNMVPVLQGSKSGSSGHLGSPARPLQRPRSGSGYEGVEIPGEFFGSFPLVNGTMTMNPWCGTDICTLNDFAEGFGAFFGAGVKESKDLENLHECLNLIHGMDDLAALLKAEETAVPIDLTASEEAIARKPWGDDAIRNRSESINRQAQHWQELRNNITFEAASREMSHLQTTKSMDETDFNRLSTEPREFSLLDTVFDHWYTNAGGETEQSTEDVLYYDSDPEDTRERTFRGGSRQIGRYDNTRRRVPKLCLLPREIILSEALGDGDIKQIVDIMKSCTLNLLWHPNPTKEVPYPKPCCVHAWIERGTYLMNQNFVRPKFMWKPAHEAHLASRRKINVKAEKFDLLEIARIESSPPPIDRSIFPLAHQPSCFSIKTKSSYFLFQAPSEEEKEDLVFGLKLVVARLASLLIVRDMAAVEEFFEPVDATVSMDATVPGQAPEWIPQSG